ncbi:hypothetical protein FACS189494_04510 [Spirochaetia bacterium]|nr:hypothetical protein FACS189494_04510 [Spirochaetia bacterium]
MENIITALEESGALTAACAHGRQLIEEARQTLTETMFGAGETKELFEGFIELVS